MRKDGHEEGADRRLRRPAPPRPRAQGPDAQGGGAHQAPRSASRPCAAAKAAEAAAEEGTGVGLGRARRHVGARGARTASELVVGRNAVRRGAARRGARQRRCYVQLFLDSDDRVREALKLAAEPGVPLLEAHARAARQAHRRRGPPGPRARGAAVRVRRARSTCSSVAAEAGEPPLIVALDGITDPRNLGAVVRSAAAFGAHGVVVPERRAAGMTASAWKTSAGAAARVPVAQRHQPQPRAQGLRRGRLHDRRAGRRGETASTTSTPSISAGPVVVVVGSEGEGSRAWSRETCDLTVGIPMTGATPSRSTPASPPASRSTPSASRDAPADTSVQGRPPVDPGSCMGALRPVDARILGSWAGSSTPRAGTASSLPAAPTGSAWCTASTSHSSRAGRPRRCRLGWMRRWTTRSARPWLSP